MDVNSIIQSTVGLQNATASYGTNKTNSATATSQVKTAAEEKTSGFSEEAYSVDISGASAQNDAIKGLTSEQIDTLKQGIQKAQELMIKTLTEQNVKMQGWLDESVGGLNFDGITISTDSFTLPQVGTTPEEAAEAVAEGGDYSVSAVADRVFTMASAIAGDDADKLEKMRAAVMEGFEQAGLAFKDATGESDMPQITQDTYDEIMSRFDDRYAELTGATKTADEEA